MYNRQFAYELYLGRVPSDHFDGVIDDVRIYDRELTPEEIAVLSAGGTCP